jgi:class I fructose-bisphosphate aldolase
MKPKKILELIGKENESLLTYNCKAVNKDNLITPSPDFIDKVYSLSNRNIPTLNNLARIFNTGRLSKTGYLSILPIDQGIEHSAGASFAPNPIYFDPENIIKLAVEGRCNAVASTFGGLAILAGNMHIRIPFIVKINHNELLTYPINMTRLCLVL